MAAIKVTRVRDDFAVVSPRIKALIVGEPGSGKTRSASTWPNVLYADAEGGTMSVRDRDVRATEITSIADLDALRAALDQTPEVRAELLGGPVDTIVIDTLDEVARMVIRERLVAEKHETMQMADWGYLGDTMRALVRGFRNLDLNVLFHVHVKGQEDADSGRFMFRPMLQGAMGDEIALYVDEAALMVARPATDPKTGDRVIARYLQTFPDSQHEWLKDRSGKLPMEFPINFENDYQRMHAAIFDDTPPAPTPTAPALPRPEPALIPPSPEPAPPAVQVAPTEPVPAVSDGPPPKKRPGRPRKIPVAVPATKNPPVTATEALDPVETEPVRHADDPLSTEPKPVPTNGSETAGDDLLAELDEVVLCKECGRPVEGQDYIDLSLMRFGEPLCRADFVARKNERRKPVV